MLQVQVVGLNIGGLEVGVDRSRTETSSGSIGQEVSETGFFGLQRCSQRGIPAENHWPGQELVDLVSITAAQYRVPVAEHIPREAEPWLKIVIVLVDGIGVAAGAEAYQRITLGEEVHRAIVAFGGRHIPLPAQAQFQ